MTEDQTIGRGEILALTTEIVSAHVANNSVVQNDVAGLIQSVFSKLSELAAGEETTSVELTPAVPIKNR
jgi:predicted transcriptional regulator